MRWSWVNFQCRGVLLVWIRVGQGPTALAVGAGGGCLDIFTLIYPFSSFSPSLWETTRYRLKYCLKGSLSPKTTNQLSSILSPLSPSLWETARYRLKYCLKGPLNPKQPTNQHSCISGRRNESMWPDWVSIPGSPDLVGYHTDCATLPGAMCV